jgi:hypothetical protein
MGDEGMDHVGEGLGELEEGKQEGCGYVGIFFSVLFWYMTKSRSLERTRKLEGNIKEGVGRLRALNLESVPPSPLEMDIFLCWLCAASSR